MVLWDQSCNERETRSEGKKSSQITKMIEIVAMSGNWVGEGCIRSCDACENVTPYVMFANGGERCEKYTNREPWGPTAWPADSAA